MISVFLLWIMEIRFHFFSEPNFLHKLSRMSIKFIFSCKLQRRSFKRDKPASKLRIIRQNMNLSVKREKIHFGIKRIFVKYYCYVNSPPFFSCDTLGVEHSNLQNKRFHHQINQTIYSIK